MTSLQAVDIDGGLHNIDRSDLSWRVHVYGVIIDEGKILLSPQHRPGAYDLPGGKVDLGEPLGAALIREVKEETGIDVEVVEQLTVRDSLFKVTFRQPQDTWHSVMIYYLCRPVGGEIDTAGLDEHEKQYAGRAEWVALSDLGNITPAASYDWRDIVDQATAN